MISTVVKKYTSIETKISSLVCWEDKEKGILFSKTKRITVTKDLLKEEFEIYERKFPHGSRKILLDMSDLQGAGKEARDYFAGDYGIYKHCERFAVYIESVYSIAYVIASIAIRVYYLRKPTKIFTSKEKALKWLKEV